ncbi:MAG: T9SS type A sorting domain-containing protein [Bacteroidota bacterium]
MSTYLKVILLFVVFSFTEQGFTQNQPCSNPLAAADLAANNARARLLTGGDLWWDGSDGRYIVPGQNILEERAVIFSGGLWIAGNTVDGELRLAAQEYGRSSGDFDFYTGPLSLNQAATDSESCDAWDKFFGLEASMVNDFITDYELDGQIDGGIIQEILEWPGAGNEYYENFPGFSGLFDGSVSAPFFDRNDNGVYEPESGDYPIAKGDEQFWWVYNDAGNVHRNTGGEPLGMEIRANAFAYSFMDEPLDLTTFYEYEMIYKNSEPLSDFYFTLWVDVDLGCFTDDYVGCAPDENLAYVYNADNFDDLNCPFNVPAYGTDIPNVAFKTLLAETSEGEEIPFSSFTYTVGGNPNSPIGEATTESGRYNLMTGRWRGGTPLTLGGNGFQTSSQMASHAFDGSETGNGPWIECNTNNPGGDRRLMMNYGPVDLMQGDKISFCFAVIALLDQPHPCPSVANMIEAANEIEDFYGGIVNSTRESQTVERLIEVFPTPAVDQYINFSAPDQIDDLILYDLSGRIILRYEGMANDTIRLDTSTLPAGVYSFKAILGNGQIGTGKLIKN